MLEIFVADEKNPNLPDPFHMPLQPYHFEEFFASRGGKSDCEVCGVNDWHIAGLPDPKLGLVNVDPQTLTLPMACLPVYSTICRNCGHMRLFSRAVLAAWMMEKLQNPGI